MRLDNCPEVQFPVTGAALKANLSEQKWFETLSVDERAELFSILEDATTYTILFKIVGFDFPPETEEKLLSFREKVLTRKETP